MLEMKFVRIICGERLFESYERVRVRCCNEKSAVKRAEESVLILNRHIERMGGERLIKRIYVSEVEGTR